MLLCIMINMSLQDLLDNHWPRRCYSKSLLKRLFQKIFTFHIILKQSIIIAGFFTHTRERKTCYLIQKRELRLRDQFICYICAFASRFFLDVSSIPQLHLNNIRLSKWINSRKTNSAFKWQLEDLFRTVSPLSVIAIGPITLKYWNCMTPNQLYIFKWQRIL